jgi:hypothetical protein
LKFKTVKGTVFDSGRETIEAQVAHRWKVVNLRTFRLSVTSRGHIEAMSKYHGVVLPQGKAWNSGPGGFRGTAEPHFPDAVTIRELGHDVDMSVYFLSLGLKVRGWPNCFTAAIDYPAFAQGEGSHCVYHRPTRARRI